jgi:hypothetical protein
MIVRHMSYHYFIKMRFIFLWMSNTHIYIHIYIRHTISKITPSVDVVQICNNVVELLSIRIKSEVVIDDSLDNPIGRFQ